MQSRETQFDCQARYLPPLRPRVSGGGINNPLITPIAPKTSAHGLIQPRGLAALNSPRHARRETTQEFIG